MASYFLGASHGQNKEKRDFYIFAFLTEGKYKRWVSKEQYIPAELFAKVQKAGLTVGDALDIRFNADGQVTSFKANTVVPRLELFTDAEEDEMQS